MAANRASTSCGASTLVGSSRLGGDEGEVGTDGRDDGVAKSSRRCLAGQRPPESRHLGEALLAVGQAEAYELGTVPEELVEGVDVVADERRLVAVEDRSDV